MQTFLRCKHYQKWQHRTRETKQIQFKMYETFLHFQCQCEIPLHSCIISVLHQYQARANNRQYRKSIQNTLATSIRAHSAKSPFFCPKIHFWPLSSFEATILKSK